MERRTRCVGAEVDSFPEERSLSIAKCWGRVVGAGRGGAGSVHFKDHTCQGEFFDQPEYRKQIQLMEVCF